MKKKLQIEIKKKPPLTPQEEIKKIFEKRMDDVRQILKYDQNGLTSFEIGCKMRIAESYVKEVLTKGEHQIQIEIEQGYGMQNF